MTYRGKVRNGVVILEPGATLPDGAEVRVEEIVPAAPSQSTTLGERLLRHAGKIKGLPADASRNHEHYLYGTPKQ